MSTVKKNGVGFTPHNLVIWEMIGAENDPTQDIKKTLDFSARPWGENGGVPAQRGGEIYPLYLARYTGSDPLVPKGRHVQGEDNERWHFNVDALRAAFKQGRLGSEEEYDGNPTTEECYDLAATTARGTGFYRLIDTPKPTPVPTTPVPTPVPTPIPEPTPTPPIIPIPSRIPPDSGEVVELRSQVKELMSTIQSIDPPQDILSTSALVNDWKGEINIGPGRSARLKRLNKWISSVKFAIDKALIDESIQNTRRNG